MFSYNGRFEFVYNTRKILVLIYQEQNLCQIYDSLTDLLHQKGMSGSYDPFNDMIECIYKNLIVCLCVCMCVFCVLTLFCVLSILGTKFFSFFT